MDEAFATVAGRYAYCVLLVTPFMGIQRSIGMWLVAQKNNHPRMWVILLALPLHAMMTESWCMWTISIICCCFFSPVGFEGKLSILAYFFQGT